MTLEELKQREEIAKLRVERLKALGGLCAAASSTAGLVGIFIYCYVFIGFIPAGLTLADTFFFVFAMLAFSVTGGVACVVGLLVYAPFLLKKSGSAVSRLPAKMIQNDNSAITLFCLATAGVLAFLGLFSLPPHGEGLTTAGFWLCAVLLIAIIVVHWLVSKALVRSTSEAAMSSLLWLLFTSGLGFVASGFASTFAEGAMKALTLVAILLASGLFVAFGLATLEPVPPAPTSPPAPAPAPLPLPAPAPAAPPATGSIQYRISMAFLGIGILLPYLLGGPVFNSVMQKLGLRADTATLLVNAANFANLEAAADTHGQFLFSCKENSDTYAVSNVRILWHGIGQRSYVELLSPPGTLATEARAVEVELDSAGVKKSRSAAVASCVELKRGVYFDSDSASLADAQWNLTLPFIRNFFDAAKHKESQVVVVGYADPMQPSSKSNFKLAEARACHLATKLVDEKLTADAATWIDVRLESDAASKCKDMTGAAQQRACFETSRRVEVQLVRPSGKFHRAGTAKASEACPRTGTPKSAGT
jgi:outer membrane protein OmpA-like peptidoglycan-associated protein